MFVYSLLLYAKTPIATRLFAIFHSHPHPTASAVLVAYYENIVPGLLGGKLVRFIRRNPVFNAPNGCVREGYAPDYKKSVCAEIQGFPFAPNMRYSAVKTDIFCYPFLEFCFFLGAGINQERVPQPLEGSSNDPV